MQQSEIKINAAKGYQNANVATLLTLNQKGWNVDRFGHATKEIDGKKYRYKFQARTMRFEVQVIHPATSYNPLSKEWMRLKSLRYSKDKA